MWKAAWCFHDEGDPAAEAWVHDKSLAVLQGHASQAAAAIRRTATKRGLEPARRKPADTCADYLLNKAPYLDYPTALAKGWPIATGVIEGACRHLVVDRLDITGARWGLQGAEAVLKLRAITSNGDFDHTGSTTSHAKNNASTTPATTTESSPSLRSPSTGAAPI